MIQLEKGNYTIDKMVRACAQSYGTLTALTTYNKPETAIAYNQLEDMANEVALQLIRKGLPKGGKAAILSESCPNWGLSYFAINKAGAVAVPVLPNFSKTEVEKILEHSEAQYVFVNAANAAKVVDSKAKVIRIEDMAQIPACEMKKLTTCKFADLIGTSLLGTDLLKKKDQMMLEERAPKEDDIASIIYTSGTTGTPKGVMLTNKNLVWNAITCSTPFIKIHRGWSALSILPLSHVYEFTIGLLLLLINGCTITYLGKAPSTNTLMPALKGVRPHIVLSVPLLIEKVYRRALAPKFKEGTTLAKFAGNRLTSRFVYNMVGRKVIKTFGGRLRFFGVGGSKLDPEVEAFLDKINFPYAIGYGLTETSPFIAGCGPKDHVVGTLGAPIEGLDVRIAPEDGEIQLKGPSIMKGYYKMPELTKETFTEDGYFRTGDLGAFEDGRLVIKGRSKSMILGSGGENIYPDNIESLINAQDFVVESLVVPEDRSLTAMVRLDIKALNKTFKDIDIQDFLEKIRSEVNQKLASFSRIHRIKLQETPFERTPTEKIKRYLYTKAM